MWILPNGRAVSIPGQHYEWALENHVFLKRFFHINVGRVRQKGDTAIRMHLLRHGCVRVNYEHKGGRLTVDAHHLHWGRDQITGCRAIIRKNLADISFVVIRLLNSRCLVVADEFANLIGCSRSSAMKLLKLCRAGTRGKR